MAFASVLIGAAMAVSSAPAPAGARQETVPANVDAEVLAGVDEGPVEVIVLLDGYVPSLGVRELRSNAAEAQAAVLDEVGTDLVVHQFETIPAFTAVVSSRAELIDLASQPGVLSVDDPGPGGTGALTNTVRIIGADSLHTSGTTGAGALVAVLDTGLDTDHPNLSPNVIVHEACFGDNFTGGFCPNGGTRQTGAGSGEDDQGHGTHVGGIVAGRGAVGPVGVAPGAQLLAIKVLDSNGGAGFFYTFSEITAALDYLAARPNLGVDVINMSLGTNQRFSGHCDQGSWVPSWIAAARLVVDTLRGQGVTLAAAAMNDGDFTTMAAPACMSDVLSVAATDTSDQMAAFRGRADR